MHLLLSLQGLTLVDHTKPSDKNESILLQHIHIITKILFYQFKHIKNLFMMHKVDNI